MNSIYFIVEGSPVAKGSTRSFVVGGAAVTTATNPKTKDWELRVATEAQNKRDGFYIPKTGKGDDGVFVDLCFYLPRPKSLPKRRMVLVTKKPDLDKLIRAALDGLTGIVFDDDSQVVTIKASKAYAEVGRGPHLCVRLFKEGVVDGRGINE